MSMPYVPLDGRGWRMAMGLRPLDDAAWLVVDDSIDRELALKTDLLHRCRETVVAVRPEGWDASHELLDEVRHFLHTYYQSRSTLVDENEHPIVAASRLVQEDLCVLVKDDQWRLQAACVCFPSRWNLANKIGTTLDEIHSPVPLYENNLSRPTNALFDRLTSDRSFWRLNWTLLDTDELFQPGTARESKPGADDWFFRVERQTLRRLRGTGAIVFTIHTYVSSLRQMMGSDPEFGENLVRAIDEAPRSMQTYKGWRGIAQRLRLAVEAG